MLNEDRAINNHMIAAGYGCRVELLYRLLLDLVHPKYNSALTLKELQPVFEICFQTRISETELDKILFAIKLRNKVVHFDSVNLRKLLNLGSSRAARFDLNAPEITLTYLADMKKKDVAPFLDLIDADDSGAYFIALEVFQDSYTLLHEIIKNLETQKG